MFGVSPAFVLSLVGTGFTVHDFCGALPRIARLGFRAYQPEIYAAGALTEWQRGAALVDRTARDLGLVPTQLVAHFMLEHFARPDALSPEGGCDDLKRVIDVAQRFPACRVVTVPAGPAQIAWDAAWVREDDAWSRVRGRLVERLARYETLARDAGLRLAFELMPFSIIGGIRRFLTFCDELRSDTLGLNLDTGHAWACRELLPALPFELDGRIFGTHLGDNLSTENVKRPPGQGSIPWKALLQNLRASGYEGSFDLEIGCPAERVDEEYGAGLKYLEGLGVA
jgi:sugar phosphate isomerase/epimerase